MNKMTVSVSKDSNMGGYFVRVYRDNDIKDIPLCESTDIYDDDMVLCDVIEAIGGTFECYRVSRRNL